MTARLTSLVRYPRDEWDHTSLGISSRVESLTGKRLLLELISIGETLLEAAMPCDDLHTARSLLFLTRSLNAARSACLLMGAGYEADAKAVGRVVCECAIEYAFITCDDRKRDQRMNLFFEHHAFDEVRREQALRDLHEDETAPSLLRAEQIWAEARHRFPRSFPWNDDFRSLKNRANEAHRVHDLAGKLTRFDLVYSLVYAETCGAAHPSPSSLVAATSLADDGVYELSDGPRELDDERTYTLLSFALRPLLVCIGESVGDDGVAVRLQQCFPMKSAPTV